MESPSGHGYIGVIMYDDKEDKVQCHICGKWFSYLGRHIYTKHGESVDNYKIRNGLHLQTPLCGVGFSRMRRDAVKDDFKNHKYSRPKPRNGLRNRKRQFGTKTVMEQNKFGLCELQMRARYEVVKKITKHIPTQEQIRKHDHALMAAIERRHKTLTTFRKIVGDKQMTVSDYQTLPDLSLIAALRKKAILIKEKLKIRHFLKSTKDFPHYSTFISRFGSWRAAMSCAGLVK